MIGAVDVPEALLGELGFRLKFYWPGELSAHAPVPDIHVMRAPAGDHPEAVGFNAQPAGAVADAVLRVYAVFGVGFLRRAAEPHVVVQIGRHGHFPRVAAGRVHREADLDGVQLADAAVADQFAGDAELGGGALLAADLEDALLCPDDVADRAALGEGHGKRFLDVDIFAGQRACDDQFGVPML